MNTAGLGVVTHRAVSSGQCPHCCGWHTGIMCPRVKLIEYNESGQVIRIEYWPMDPLQQPQPIERFFGPQVRGS